MSVFCSLPFNSMHIDSNGSTRPCCAFAPTKPVSLENYPSSQELAEVKESFLNGKFPKQCYKCELNEKLNNTSFRKVTNIFDSEETQIKQAGASYNKIKNLSIVTSNTCNLKCLPCIGNSYIRVLELEKLKIIPNIGVMRMDEMTKTNIDTISDLDTVERLTFAGGEPFVDKITFDIIDGLIDRGTSKNIRLDINTNLTMISKEQLEKLKNNFKEVLIKGSIDGVRIVNDYLRYPSEWSTIVSSIKLIKELELNFVITTAMSNLALMRYYQLLEWAAEQEVTDMFQSIVINVSSLIPTNLPIEIKQDLLVRYKELRKHVTSELTSEVVDSCISICESNNDHSIIDTIDFLKKHDNLRGTDYSTVWPELKQYE